MDGQNALIPSPSRTLSASGNNEAVNAMSQVFDPTVIGALLGVADADGGPTSEQLHLIEVLSSSLFPSEAPSLASMPALSPDEAAEAIREPQHRERLVQLAIVVGFCRHPETPEQLGRIEDLARALDVTGDQIDEMRVLATRSARQATLDHVRRYANVLDQLSEPTLVSAAHGVPDFSVLETFTTMDEGSLGRAYVDFHRRNGFAIPGPDTPEPAYYVSHDMNHVIAGYEPTGPGEIALGAFKVAMGDTDANWMAFMTNLLIHEFGLMKHGSVEQFVPYGGEIYPDELGQGALHLPGAPVLLAEAFARGLATTIDFSQLDHIAMAPRQLSELRAEFGVQPRADGFDGGTGLSWSN